MLTNRLEERLARGRATAEALMTDECVVVRKTGTATDPNTGAVTDQYATVYTGRCGLKMTSETGSDRRAGQQTVTLSRIEVKLPWTVDMLEVDDYVKVRGRWLLVTAPWMQTHSTQCRYPCAVSTVNPDEAA